MVVLHAKDGERWIFRCDCGTEKAIRRRNVECGATKSCGCLQREATSRAKSTHGHSRDARPTLTFSSYRNMMARCYRPSNNRYAEYGARGIAVCDRWRGNFENFLADMGERPSAAHSIERKDNDGPYEPSNCIWGTKDIQAQNRSSNLIVDVDGERLVLAEAARRSGVPYGTLKARIFKHGWDHRRALTEPVRKLTKRSA